MTNRAHRLRRLAARAEGLEGAGGGNGGDVAEVVAGALRGLWWASVGVAGVLAGLALGAAGWVGDGRAAWVSGVPAGVVGVAAWAGWRVRWRRVAMVVATAATGYLLLAVMPGAVALGRGGRGAEYSLACALVCAVHLGVAWPAWRRANVVGRQAEAWRALRDEL